MIELYSEEAEIQTLATIFTTPESYFDIARIINAESFFVRRHKSIFTAIAALYSRDETVNFFTVAEETKKLDSEVPITEILDIGSMYSYSNPELTALRVKEYHMRRMLVAKAAELTRDAHDMTCSIHAVYGELGKFSEVQAESEKTSVYDLCQDYFTELHGGDEPVLYKTGIAELDEKIGGFEPGDLVVVAARPSVGKTALMVTLSSAIEENQGIISAEMTKKQLLRRYLAQASGLPISKLKKQDMTESELKHLDDSIVSFAERRLHISEKVENEVQITNMIKYWSARHDKKVFFIDYLGLIPCSQRGLTRDREIGVITGALKKAAKATGTVIVLLAQLNREYDKRKNPQPMLSDLRDSGNIEQDANTVIFIDRKRTGTEIAEYGWLSVLKHRDGEVGSIPVHFVKDVAKFQVCDPAKVREVY